ncbi:alpha/beta hydrolase [Salinimicrobium gaetbulicola]|uniref:Alpha/beta hydrolase n=1 Tax=Salinimicrobium gaetbulicola TaxID=999702 RepID=A0ABW3IH79_9FLAO
MSKIYLFLAIFFAAQLSHSQTIYKTINSTLLGEERQLKIQLPRNYDENSEKYYPVILVLDGDYLFEPFAGNVDYFSYWDDIPEAIVVGINQSRSRRADTFYNDIQYFPAKSGKNFFDFIGAELFPFLNRNYRTTNFNVIAGHDLTANFANFYLFKDNPLFQAYINLSPDLSPEMATRLYQALSDTRSDKWFYLATASNDVAELREYIKKLDYSLSTLENENLHYQFDDFEKPFHYSLVAHAIPRALEKIFEAYKPISLDEYEEIKAADASPYNYLTKKYNIIKNLYGLNIPVRLNDFLAVGKALEHKENWDDLEKLGKLAMEQDPDSMLGSYYIAKSLEETGKTKKAMRMYEGSYDKKEAAFITADFMIRKAELIKKEYGY